MTTGLVDFSVAQVKDPDPAAVLRALGPKVFEFKSIEDTGATPGSGSDAAPAINAALQAYGQVLIPPGDWHTNSPILIPRGKRVLGFGPLVSRIFPQHSGAAFEIEEAETVNSYLGMVGIRMGTASTGIQVTGHRVTLEHTWFEGGEAGSWAIDMIDCNESQILYPVMGLPGIEEFTGNGIRWRNSDPATNPVNYGDSIVIQPIIRLSRENTTGVMLDGGGEGNVINNINFDRVQVTASAGGGTPISGTIGLKLKNASRNRLIGGGFEAIEVGVDEEATGSTGGLENIGNSYFGVYTINATTPYRDTNGSIANSVKRTTFMGCRGFPQHDSNAGPDGPVRISDSVFGEGAWFESQVSGLPDVRVGQEAGESGTLYVTEGIPDNGWDGTRPKGGIKFVVSGNNGRIEPSDKSAPGGNDVRLFIGRGDSTMRIVQIESPLGIWTAPSGGPVSPIDNMLVYADGTNWDPGLGAGLYFREGGTFKKVSLTAP